MREYKENSKEIEKFVAQMKDEFSKIPKNLSSREYRARAERARSLYESYSRQQFRKIEAKKYQLLSQKYEQLAKQAEQNSKPKYIPIHTERKVELIQEEKPSFWKRLFGRN